MVKLTTDQQRTKTTKPQLSADHKTTRLHRPTRRSWRRQQRGGNKFARGAEEEEILTTWLEKIGGKKHYLLLYFNLLFLILTKYQKTFFFKPTPWSRQWKLLQVIFVWIKYLCQFFCLVVKLFYKVMSMSNYVNVFLKIAFIFFMQKILL